MERIYPFDQITGAPGTSGDWLNANLALGIEGSVADVRAWDHPQAEILNMIEGVLGDGSPSGDDLTQLLQASTRLHRITEDTTYYVPGDFETIQDCFIALSTKIIPSTVTVTINLGAGDHLVTVATGSVLLTHPYGNRIKIVGQPLTGNFPIFADIDNASAAVVEAALRAKFPTRIVVQGALRAGFYQRSGFWNLVENLLFIGDKTPGQHGLMIGEWQNEMGSGHIGVRNCWFHNFGADNCRVNFVSAIQGYRLGASHSGSSGFRCVNTSSMQVLGGWISAWNTAHGLDCQDNAFAELVQSEGDFRRNGGNGISVTGSSSFQAGGATALRIKNNTSPGVFLAGSSFASLKGLDGGSNGTADVQCTQGSHIQSVTPVGTPVLSPAANTIGNQNSYISQ